MENSYSWPIKETLMQIEADLLILEDLLPKTDEVLARDHNTADDILLELILANMRSTTKSFYISLQRGKKVKNKNYLKNLTNLAHMYTLMIFAKKGMRLKGN